MARAARPDNKQVVARLAAIRSQVAQLPSLLPNTAGAVRRTICEDLEDLMRELA